MTYNDQVRIQGLVLLSGTPVSRAPLPASLNVAGSGRRRLSGSREGGACRGDVQEGRLWWGLGIRER